MGGRAGVDLARLVRVQRQLLRRPAAGRRRPPDGGQRRRPPGRPGPAEGLADPALRPARRACSRSPVASCRTGPAPLQRPELLANVRLDIEGVERIPRTGPVIAVFNHRSYFDGARRRRPCSAGPAGRSASSGRRRCSTCPSSGSSARWPGASASTGRPAPTSRWSTPSRRLQAGEAVALAPEGTIPRGPAFFDPELKGRWGAARLAQATRRAGHPGRAVGHGEGVAAQPRLPKIDLRNRPTIRVRVGDPVAAEAPQPGRRHEADHGGDRRPAPARGADPPHADGGGAGRDVPGRLHAAIRHVETDPPARHRHLRASEEAAMAEPNPTTQREQRFERRMSDAEALMWNVEKDPWLNPSGGSLVMLDRPLDVDHFRAQLAATVADGAAAPGARRAPGSAGSARRCGGPTRSSTSTTTSAGSALPTPGDERQLLDLVGADLPGSLRPHPAAVDVLRHRRSGGRPRGAGLEDPPHRRRRHRRRPARRGLPPADPTTRRRRRRSTSTPSSPLRSTADARRAGGARRSSSSVARHRHPHRPAPGRHRPSDDGRGGDVGGRSAARPRHRRRRRPHRRPARASSSPAVAAATPGGRRRRRRRLAAVADAVAPPPPGGAVVPARRRAGRGEGASAVRSTTGSSPASSTGPSPTTTSGACRCARSTRASSSARGPTGRSAATRSRRSRFVGAGRSDGSRPSGSR